jgi:hypothetical protein
MVVVFLVTDAGSGENLAGNLIVSRMGKSIVYPFVDGKVDVPLSGLGVFSIKVAYEVWVPGYVPRVDFFIGVYPRTINVKLAKIKRDDE